MSRCVVCNSDLTFCVSVCKLVLVCRGYDRKKNCSHQVLVIIIIIIEPEWQRQSKYSLLPINQQLLRFEHVVFLLVLSLWAFYINYYDDLTVLYCMKEYQAFVEFQKLLHAIISFSLVLCNCNSKQEKLQFIQFPVAAILNSLERS